MMAVCDVPAPIKRGQRDRGAPHTALLDEDSGYLAMPPFQTEEPLHMDAEAISGASWKSYTDEE